MNFLTPDEVAERTKLCLATIRRLCQRGEIQAVKLAGNWRIPEDAYHEWIAASTPPPPDPGVASVDAKVGKSSTFGRHLRAIEPNTGGDAA